MVDILSPVIKKYCEKAILKLTKDDVENFKNNKSAEERIKSVYDIAKGIPIVKSTCGKNEQEAEKEKIKGNQFFAKKNYDDALKAYNAGILLCPQNTDSSRELLTILISNRSATYFELKEYKRVFNDIDYILEIGNYPIHLQYKIWLRKAKCYDALQNERSSSEAYNEATHCLKNSKLDEKTIETKLKEIELSRNNKPKTKPLNELVPVVNADIFVGGNEYINCHPNISIEQDNIQGRYAVAVDDIEVGTVILEETPHCSIITSKNATSNCQHCSISLDQPIACPNCAFVAFCSSNCERLSNKSYHKYECSILKSMYDINMSDNCCLALRIVTQKPLQFFKDKQNKLKDFLKDNCKKNILKKKTYRADDYDNVFFLCRNENISKKEELIPLSCMAIYLLRLLKLTNYFGENVNQEKITEDETFIVCLILRHLELLRFNAHEVSELRNLENPTFIRDVQSFYENTAVGAALYPTLAFFNHSCDPTIVRYNIKNRIIVRTIKPVKAGDIIYENYGPLYMRHKVEDRQKELYNKYLFECLCIPCVELWPLYDEMDENELRIPCKADRCPYVFNVKPDDEPFLTCEYCKTVTNLFPFLKGLMILEEILPQAELLFSMGQLDNAMKKYINALEILYKYSKSPHPEIIKVQQRIRICMVHFGNKACNYELKLET